MPISGYSSLALNRLDKSKKALTRTSDGSTLRLSKFRDDWLLRRVYFPSVLNFVAGGGEENNHGPGGFEKTRFSADRGFFLPV